MSANFSNSESCKYTLKGSPVVKEKLDKKLKKGDEGYPNFCTLFLKSESARNNIIGAESWLFEILEKNETTVNMLDLTKYILHKTMGFDYGVTVYDLEIFQIIDFISMGSGIYGDTIELKVWFALINAGYTKEAAAGVLGNLYVESGLKTNNLENSKEAKLGSDEVYTEKVNSGEYSLNKFMYDGGGYGLAQWTYCTRKQGLYNYAKSKGVGIDDEIMQIEYLLGEINPSGGANGYANYSLSSYKGSTYNDWYNAETPEEAAKAFCWIFEKPASYSSTRETKAREYYEAYKDLELGGFFEASSDPKLIGTFTSTITGRTFTIYNQCAISGWGNRCNRAAQISICSGYYAGDATDLIYRISEYAPRDGLYGQLGLTYSDQSNDNPTYATSKIRAQLTNGGYLLLYVKGSEAYKTGIGKSRKRLGRNDALGINFRI